MSNKFSEALEIILHHEGGYVNHPKDPGGETNLGVTKRVYEDFGGEKEMKDLTKEDVEPIYKKNYWDRVKGDDLPEGLDLSQPLDIPGAADMSGLFMPLEADPYSRYLSSTPFVASPLLYSNYGLPYTG